MTRKALFGGSFDPLHFGHIALAVQLMEKHLLDEILFCPTYCSPFKKEKPPLASGEHRLNMLQKALHLPQFQVCSLEVERKGISYTIDTLKELNTPHLFLLLSEKSEEGLKSWKEADEIQKRAQVLIGTLQIHVSSTEIRERLKKNLYCEHLVPREVLDYIRENQLY